jgi:hypothetical protein
MVVVVVVEGGMVVEGQMRDVVVGSKVVEVGAGDRLVAVELDGA